MYFPRSVLACNFCTELLFDRVCFLLSFFLKFWRGQIVPLAVFLRDNFNCSAGLAQWRGLAQTLHKVRLLEMLWLKALTTPKLQISVPFHVLKLVKLFSFHLAEAWKKVPLSGRAFLYWPSGSDYPPPHRKGKGGLSSLNIKPTFTPPTDVATAWIFGTNSAFLGLVSPGS